MTSRPADQHWTLACRGFKYSRQIVRVTTSIAVRLDILGLVGKTMTAQVIGDHPVALQLRTIDLLFPVQTAAQQAVDENYRLAVRIS